MKRTYILPEGLPSELVKMAQDAGEVIEIAPTYTKPDGIAAVDQRELGWYCSCGWYGKEPKWAGGWRSECPECGSCFGVVKRASWVAYGTGEEGEG